MKETLLLYHVSLEIEEKMRHIMQQLNGEVVIIKESQIDEKMGYILGLPGYESQAADIHHQLPEQEFVFFAGMNDEQLDLMLQIFKMSGIPKIPYKAMLTKHNVNYTFYQLYASVADEYAQMSA